MGSTTHVRPTPTAGARLHGGEPATLAFRRPADNLTGTAQQERWDIPVLLRLPDVHAPAAATPALLGASGSNPLVGKLMWAVTGLLAVLAVWLVATGSPDQPRSNPEAPAWNTSDAVAPAADGPNDGALRPVPNWKTPSAADASAHSDPAAGRGPWRSGAQIIQPGAPGEGEPGAPERPTDPGSAAWPGDTWAGRRPDVGQPPATQPTYSNEPAEAGSVGPVPPAAAPPADPWPGDPAWPDDARQGNPNAASGARTARRPSGPTTNSPAAGPAARLDGSIQNMDVNSSYDGTRSSIH